MAPAPRIRIESDGTLPGSHVYAGDVEIPATRVDFSLDVHDPRGKAILHVFDVGTHLEATLAALHVTKLPAPAEEYVLTVSPARWTWRGRRSRLTLEQHVCHGTDYTICTPLIRCDVPASDPLVHRFPGEPAVYEFA